MLRVVRRHGHTSGADLADGEWLAGWIALRFQGKPAAALAHFETMYQTVNYPISRTRGAYWAGRAAEAMGDSAAAARWYRLAAAHPLAFYGQHAAARLGPENGMALPDGPAIFTGLPFHPITDPGQIQAGGELDAPDGTNPLELLGVKIRPAFVPDPTDPRYGEAFTLALDGSSPSIDVIEARSGAFRGFAAGRDARRRRPRDFVGRRAAASSSNDVSSASRNSCRSGSCSHSAFRPKCTRPA